MNNDIFISLIIALFFLIFTISLPVYDNVNGFHNLVFDDYKLTWYDGRSPANLYLILNLLENKSLSFPEGYIIGNTPVENHYDFERVGDVYKPWYHVMHVIFFSAVLYFVPFRTVFQLFKILIFFNIVLSSITLVIFYLIQRLLDLKKKYSIISALIAGIATSMLIYSRYLFLAETLYTLIFMILIYTILRNWKKQNRDILISFIFALYILFSHDVVFVLGLFIFFLYLFHKYKIIKSVSIFAIFSIVALIFSWLYAFVNFQGYGIHYNLIYSIFPHYINAPDYGIYCFHNETSVWKIERSCSFIYGFSQGKGNAIFLFTHGTFQSLFGPKGFVFNSPLLIFSIFGIFAYKQKEKRKFIVSIILLLIISYSLYFGWHGGVTPRYVRYFKIPILLLTFFSFYFIQETKNILARLIFIVLVILSILNVTSLAVRADWTYEHEADLVSYDLVLWPYIPSKGINLDLTINEWKENPLCPNEYQANKVNIDICNCNQPGFISKDLTIKREYKNLEIVGCAQFSGGDGLYSKVFIDSEEVYKGFIPWNECDRIVIDISRYADDKQHLLNISLESFGVCDAEFIEYKRVAFIE